jgi:hypothetical protein
VFVLPYSLVEEQGTTEELAPSSGTMGMPRRKLQAFRVDCAACNVVLAISPLCIADTGSAQNLPHTNFSLRLVCQRHIILLWRGNTEPFIRQAIITGYHKGITFAALFFPFLCSFPACTCED